MSNHYYAINEADYGLQPSILSNWTVGTSSASGADFEVRITDGTLTGMQVAEALRALAEFVEIKDPNLIAPATLTI